MAVEAAFDHDAKTLDGEEIRHGAERLQCQKLEARIGPFIGIARGLPLLDHRDQRIELRIVLGNGDAATLELVEEIRLAALVGHHDLAEIADTFGLDMFVGLRILEQCRGVDAGLGGEGRAADIRALVMRRAVEKLIEGPRQAGQTDKLVPVDRDLEARRIGFLQTERRNDGDEVGIAAALADAIERALDLARARFDRGEGICDRLAGVVMRVDAERGTGDAGCDHGRDDVADLRRLRAAIGVAEHHPAGTGLVCLFRAGKCVLGIGFVTVEKMLAVDHGKLARRDHGLDAVTDAFEVFLIAAAQRHFHVIVPAFRHQADGIRLGLDELAQARIVGGGNAGALGHAEGDEAGLLRALPGEECRVGRVRSRIAAFDEVDAELVQHGRDGDLVLDREVDARRLLAVAERRVEQSDLFKRHAAILTKTFAAGELPPSVTA